VLSIGGNACSASRGRAVDQHTDVAVDMIASTTPKRYAGPAVVQNFFEVFEQHRGEFLEGR